MKTNKETALDFLGLCEAGNSRVAFELYVGNDFKHHNIFFKGDAESLIVAMEESAKNNPDKTFEPLRALEDGNLVAVHSKAQLNPNQSEVSLMHIFKFDSDKIVELWDFGQVVPENPLNENGMF